MKTGGMEVLCDACRRVIPPIASSTLFVTVRGPRVGHVKADLCDAVCLRRWAEQFRHPVQFGRERGDV